MVINGSYRKNGTTTRCLQARTNKILEMENIVWLKEMWIPDDFRGCLHCQTCDKKCYYFNDEFIQFIQAIRESSHILIGTPVYLDFPSPKLLALLSRLTCMAESTNRKFFKGKKVYLHANGYVSETKTTIGILMRACEMLGFDILGRSTSEYIEKWNDKKVRGGITQEEACFLED